MIYKRVQKAEEVKDMEFYAFSYYYDRAVDLGLIGMHCTSYKVCFHFTFLTVCHCKGVGFSVSDEKDGGFIRVSHYIDGAKTGEGNTDEHTSGLI